MFIYSGECFMKILMPFWNIDLIDRYYPQFKAIRNEIDEFNIVYMKGNVKENWLKDFNFHKVKMKNKHNKHLTYLLNTKDVYNQIKNIDVDLYYSLSGIWLQYYSSYFKKYSDKPFVLRLRGNDKEVRKQFKQHWLKIKLFEIVNKSSLLNADYIIPISEKLISVALSYGVHEPNITDVLYNGVDTNIFKPFKTDRYKEYTVGYSGRISMEKGSKFLEFLMKRMNTVAPHIKFLIAGDLQDEITIYDNCRYLGKLSYEEMPLFYNMCDIIILPSYTEGFSNVILEAYSCCKTLLCSNASIPDEVKLYGFKEKHCALTWIELLSRLKYYNLNDLELDARDYIINNFSWDNYGKTIRANFDRIVQEK